MSDLGVVLVAIRLDYELCFAEGGLRSRNGSGRATVRWCTLNRVVGTGQTAGGMRGELHTVLCSSPAGVSWARGRQAHDTRPGAGNKPKTPLGSSWQHSLAPCRFAKDRSRKPSAVRDVFTDARTYAPTEDSIHKCACRPKLALLTPDKKQQYSGRNAGRACCAGNTAFIDW